MLGKNVRQTFNQLCSCGVQEHEVGYFVYMDPVLDWLMRDDSGV